MFRGAAAAGLSITLGLAGASAFAGAASAAPLAKTDVAAVAGGGSGGASSPPNATSQCDPTPTPPTSGIDPLWAEHHLDYQSAWQFSEGAGIKVAVIDSGVDANSQFGNRVTIGRTFVSAQSGPADGDCFGHGTLVAGIIGAAPASPNKPAGVAPQAQILSLKVSGATSNDNSVNPNILIAAINQAVQDGARIINISIATTAGPGGPQSLQGLQTAVKNALSHNIVVVASAGNDQVSTNTLNGSQQIKQGPYYPAQYAADYPGMLSVGAVNTDGSLAFFSDTKTYVSVTAPGADIESTFPSQSGDAYGADQGTSFAAPFVSGLAALIWSRYPSLTAAQVVQQIKETADGSSGAGTGNGLINPLEAVTAVEPPVAPPTQAPRPGAVTVDRAPSNFTENAVALSLAGGAFVLVVVVIAASVVIPAGRRRRWRSGESA